MLSQEQHDAIPYEEWAAKWHESEPERLQRARDVEQDRNATVQANASVVYADGQVVALSQTAEGWRLEQPLVSSSTASSPTQALQQFLVALQTKDVEALLSLLSKERRTSIETRLASFRESLQEQDRQGDSELFQITPTRAELNWSQDDVRYRLVFLLEGANWRIDELHMGPDPSAMVDEEEAVDPAQQIRLRR